MDEKRTLSILGWIMGSLLGAIFLLNAISMSEGLPPSHPFSDLTAGFGTISTSLN
jgi:hypothetical protein